MNTENLNTYSHEDWIKTNRTHEECCGCPFANIMPAPCSGHVEGPVACSDKPKLMAAKNKKVLKDIIPKAFYNGDNKPWAGTVGKLIDELQRLPRNLDVRHGFTEGCNLVVYNVTTDDAHLEIIDAEDFDDEVEE